jgi:hypothetical protein
MTIAMRFHYVHQIYHFYTNGGNPMFKFIKFAVCSILAFMILFICIGKTEAARMDTFCGNNAYLCTQEVPNKGTIHALVVFTKKTR